jgi:magnesium chelatase family protein
VLFLDEIPEFGHGVLEVLRQPLEDKHISISRARYAVDYPSNFTLIASMNPCPCGYYNHPTKECSCSSAAVHRYMGRISGPLMDRIDMHVEITPVTREEMSAAAPAESSAAIRERVMRAREVQARRFAGSGIHTNTMMSASMLREFCPLDVDVRRLLDMAMERLQLSARAYDRIIKVARTIADLEGEERISAAHISEAITYRSLDRDSWGR